MPWLNRRRTAAIAIIVIGIIGVYVGLLLRQPTVQPTAPKPPTPGGGGNGGNASGGGSGGGTKDTQPPTTIVTIVGHGYSFTRSRVAYYSTNFTVALDATDDEKVSAIYLWDNGSAVSLPPLTWSSSGEAAWTSTTITTSGLHILSYYSMDNSSNTEVAHNVSRGIGKPLLSDLANMITKSGIDNAGIKNAMLATVSAAMTEQATGKPMQSLDALLNQLNALDGKHGLDKATVTGMESMIRQILAG